MDCDAARVTAFLTSVQNLLALSNPNPHPHPHPHPNRTLTPNPKPNPNPNPNSNPNPNQVQNLLALSAKSGHPSADDCGRYLRSVGENEEQVRIRVG